MHVPQFFTIRVLLTLPIVWTLIVGWIYPRRHTSVENKQTQSVVCDNTSRWYGHEMDMRLAFLPVIVPAEATLHEIWPLTSHQGPWTLWQVYRWPLVSRQCSGQLTITKLAHTSHLAAHCLPCNVDTRRPLAQHQYPLHLDAHLHPAARDHCLLRVGAALTRCLSVRPLRPLGRQVVFKELPEWPVLCRVNGRTHVYCGPLAETPSRACPWHRIQMRHGWLLCEWFHIFPSHLGQFISFSLIFVL